MSANMIVLSASLIWLVAIISPGPAFLVMSLLAIGQSCRTAVGAAFGLAAASIMYAALTMFGLGILMLRVAWFGDLVRILGGCYLVWLGIQAWRTEKENGSPTRTATAAKGVKLWDGIRIGLLTEITNPKSIVAYSHPPFQPRCQYSGS